MKRKKIMHRPGVYVKGLWIALLLLSPVMPGFSAHARGYQDRPSYSIPQHQNGIPEYPADMTKRYASNNRGKHGKQHDMQDRYREWQGLSPQEKQRLRQRYEKWNRMPKKDRNRYQRRFEQWQQLSPKEQKRLKKQLNQWDTLSPQEKERIRRRFKK